MSTNSTSKSSSRAQSSKEDKSLIIGIDLGTIFSWVELKRNGRVDIVQEPNSWKNIISSSVCFTPKKILIIRAAGNKMRQVPESSMFKSKRLLEDKYSNVNVHKDIERWLIKIIEDPKT